VTDLTACTVGCLVYLMKAVDAWRMPVTDVKEVAYLSIAYSHTMGIPFVK